MNMTNEEKAIEIYKDNLYDCEVRGLVQDKQEILFMLEKMAKWKDQQLIDKACKFLKSYRQDTPDGLGYIAGIVNDKTIEDFKKYMEGE